jgi:hypothetical protein
MEPAMPEPQEDANQDPVRHPDQRSDGGAPKFGRLLIVLVVVVLLMGLITFVSEAWYL